jgi:response regulator RpfG family c-di-GMP phosphodiesterase
MQNTQNTILIVDDEPMVATALRSFLELETSYRVVTFNDPGAALEAVGAEAPDVIIADFMMPGMDGITFLRKARELRPVAARVLLTGYADKQNAIRAVNEAGLYYYFEKPWDNEHLRMVVRNGVERSALFNQLDSRITALEAANLELHGFRQRLIQAFL